MRDIIGHGGGKSGGEQHVHYEATDSLHSISFARVLDLISEGEILGLAKGMESVYLNGTPAQNPDGSSNFQNVAVDFRSGTQDQDYIAGFPSVESETAVGVELTSTTPWTHSITNLELDAIRITLGVPSLSKADTTNGDITGYRIGYQIELATDGGAYDVVLSNAFNGKTTSAYQRSARIDLPAATTGWTIKVTRLTANAHNVAISDTTTIVSYTDVIDAKLRYPMSAIVGIQVDAKQFQSVPTRAYDMFGRIVQVPSNYDPITLVYTGIWDGTFKPAWTSNPAWIFRDLILNDRYGLGHRITSSQIDKWALYKIAQYCDELVSDGKGGTEPRFSCNVYLQSQKQAYAVLQDLASVFRGISYWGAGTIMASADMPSDPVYIYTAANVIGGKFSRAGSRKSTRYTTALVSWNDMSDMGKAKVEYVEDAEGIERYGIQQVALTAFGCTSQGQAQRVGRWALATSRLETGMITFDVGMDGAIALPGQIIRVADPSRMGRRNGGRIRTASGLVVTLDKAPAIAVGDALTVILPTGTSETRTVTAVSGDDVSVDSAWASLPVAQSVWSVDNADLVAPMFKVISVTEKDAVTFTISASQHEPGKYDYVENNTAIVTPSQSVLDVSKQEPPASVTVTGFTVSLQDVQKLAISVACPPVTGAVGYEGAYRRDNSNWVAIARQLSPTIDIVDVLPGTYVAKLSAVNSIGIASVETLSAETVIDRNVNPRNAGILLTPSAPAFHVDTGGAVTPSSITFTASLLDLEGAISFSATGGTLSGITATSADLADADMSMSDATVTASVTVNGDTFSATCTISKVFDGASAAYVVVSVPAQAFTRANSAASFAPTSITLTATPYGGTATYQWQYWTGSAWTNVATGGTSATYTVAAGDFTDARTYRVQATIGSTVYTDQMTLVQLTGGSDGTNAISGFLTNEAVTLAADSSGTVSDFNPANGTFRIYDGITEVTGPIGSVSYFVASQTGCTASITEGGDYFVSDMVADSAVAVFDAFYGGITLEKVLSLSKSRAGNPGNPGSDGTDGTQVATVQLYQWGPSTPAAPTGTSTHTWATGGNASYTGSDGWSVSVPSNPGTPGLSLHVAQVAITAAAGTATSSVSYSGASVQAWAQNGATGTSGVQSGAAIVYQWAATIPAGPTGSATFTWSDGSFGAAPTGYSLTPGTAPSAGYTLWAARVQITDSATNSTTAFNWTSAAIMAVGYAGNNGGPGDQGAAGASYVTAYCASSTASTTTAPAATTGKTSLPATNDGGLVGTYSSTVPSLTSGQFMYQTDGIYDPSTNQVTWSIPYWSSLKVATLSAITANLGAINAGSMDIGTGTTSWHVDSSGNTWAGASSYASAPYRVSNTGAAVFTNVTISTGGNTILDSGGLKSGYEAPGTLNSGITMGSNGLLAGAGGGQVTIGGLGYSGDLDATNGAPAGTLVAGVAASTVATATTNFNASNDRNSAAVTAPTIASDGTAVDHTIRADGAADVSFEWSWSGTEGDIDGFLVYAYQSSSSGAYTFGTTPAAETVYTVPAAKRAFILFGAAANLYTTFGVQAYRAVDKDIASTGSIKSTLVKPSLAAENPFRPSSNVAFTGNVTGTVNGIAATNVNVWASISGTGKPEDNANNTTNTNQLTDGAGLGTTATWTGVSGAGKPADNATVGAPAGTNVGSTAATTVESNAANGQSAYSAVNDASTGLAQRLRSNAQNILSGGAALTVGSLVTDGSGNRVSGYGLGLSAYGIAAYNSSGVATITINASTGAITLSGDLTGSTGTFYGVHAGSLSAVTGNFYTLTIASGGYMRSANFSSGSAGFSFNADGSAELGVLSIRGAPTGPVSNTFNPCTTTETTLVTLASGTGLTGAHKVVITVTGEIHSQSGASGQCIMQLYRGSAAGSETTQVASWNAQASTPNGSTWLSTTTFVSATYEFSVAADSTRTGAGVYFKVTAVVGSTGNVTTSSYASATISTNVKSATA